MPIPFNCPHCGNHTMVSEEYAGQTGPCSACGQKVTVPMPGGALGGPVGKPARSSGGGGGGVVFIIVGVAAVCLLMFMGILLVALLLPAVQAARTAARRAQSSNNLKMIGLSLHNYHDTYRTFPAAYIPNDDGSPRCSWRLSVLPFLEQSPLFDQTDLNKNWDDPVNAAIRATPLPLFQSPNADNTMANECNYLLITGEGTAFEDGKWTRLADMLDGTSNVALAIEVNGLGVEWSQPKDIDIDDLDRLFAEGRVGSAGSVAILMADGAVQHMDLSTAQSSLPTMARIADGR